MSRPRPSTLASVARGRSTIQQKLDRLDEAFLYSESIDLTSYSRQRDKLREELTLAKIEHHTEAVDELDVEGILAFAERILPRASDVWVQASLDYKQRLQQLFFPEGIAYDGKRFNRTAVTPRLFRYLAPAERAEESLVSRVRLHTAPVRWGALALLRRDLAKPAVACRERASGYRRQAKAGEPRRNRTYNPQIKSLLLCQLS